LTVSSNAKQNEVYHFTPSNHPALHPGQTAAIYHGNSLLGLLGAVHPSLVQTLELTPPVYMFELRLAPLCQAFIPKFKGISKYPSLRRDIALSVSSKVSASELLNCVKLAATETLIDWQLFDLYQGEGIEPGKKSLAIGLIFQADSHNLTDSEVDSAVGQVLYTLEQNLGAQLRK
jgi:phenylalanyl-tRNA synthetase beta chain